MGERGPAPLPRSIKERRATLKPCRDNQNEPEPRDFSQWEAPEWLNPTARSKYQTLALELSSIGVLKSTDADVLALYCQTYAEVLELTRLVEEHGRTDSKGTRSSPYVVQLREATRQALLLSRELGLTPSARSRVVVEQSQEKERDLLC